MDFKEYQMLSKKTDVYSENINKGYEGEDVKAKYRLYYTLFGLCSEVGELHSKIKKVIRGDKKEEHFLDNVEGELGDILWYISAICTEIGIELDFVAKKNLKKLFYRIDKDKIKGNGDNR